MLFVFCFIVFLFGESQSHTVLPISHLHAAKQHQKEKYTGVGFIGLL